MKKLVREADNLVREGTIEFVLFDKNGSGKNIQLQPEIGASCIVNRTENSFTWMTSEITKVVNNREFETKNNKYKIEYFE
jgi:hypothetical protein